MKSRLLLLGIAVLVAISMLACESKLVQTESETGKTASTGSYAAATSVKYYTCNVLEKEPNKTDVISFPVNKGVTVILCSNRSTGFQWSEQAEIEDTSVVKQVSHVYVPPVSDEVGAAGTEKFFFTGVKTGKTTVYLEYSQPGEGGEKAAWTCTLTITVK